MRQTVSHVLKQSFYRLFNILRIMLPKLVKARNRRLDDGELRKLMDAFEDNPVMLCLIQFTIETGMRGGDRLLAVDRHQHQSADGVIDRHQERRITLRAALPQGRGNSAQATQAHRRQGVRPPTRLGEPSL